MKRQPGFTIVELLIVIVVIAILAAITIVSYNGITSRAREMSQLSVVKDIEKSAKVKGITTGSIRPGVDYLADWQLQALQGKLYTTYDDSSNRNKERFYFSDWQEDGVEFIELYWWNPKQNSWMHSTITNSGTYENIPGTPIDVNDIPGGVG